MVEQTITERDWINLRFPDPRFIDGVKTFVKFVEDHFPNRDTTQCPCNLCKNQRIPIPYEDVKIDLYKNGFNPTYKIWYLHGESKPSEQTDFVQGFENEEEDIFVDDFDEVLLNSMAQDPSGNPDAFAQDKSNPIPQGEEQLNEDAQMKYNNLPHYLEALYPGCEHSVLNFTRRLLNLKVSNGWSSQSFTELLQLWKEMLPSDNKVPKNTHYAVKTIKDVKLGYTKIHACRNDCILYWGKHSSKSKCPKCDAPRFRPIGIGSKIGARVPVKVLRYFPLTPRLQRMYSVPWLAKEMTWHSNGRSPPGKMKHPVDSSTWKSLDKRYKDFSGDPRNVRLGLATDGFNPFSTFSTSYSCWPVMCVPYNLPPNLCMKPQFTMLTLLIEGPRQPGKDIDVYLQPLVAELQELWKKGVPTYDAFNKADFNMRSMLLWCIHDFPAYENVSGCRTKGKFGCPCCGPKTDSFWLRYGRKHVYMGSRRWLPHTDASRRDTSVATFNKKEELRGQPLRLDGAEVENMTAGINVQWGKKRK